MLHKQTDGRLVRAATLGLTTALGGYLSYSLWKFPPGGNGSIGAWINTNSVQLAVILLLLFLGIGFFIAFVHQKTSEYLIEVDSEAKKIHWPTWLQAKASTGQILSVIVFLAIFFLVVDFIFRYLRQWIL